jgi:hypothetical protein
LRVPLEDLANSLLGDVPYLDFDESTIFGQSSWRAY